MIYRIRLYYEGAFVGAYTVKDRIKLKREVHWAVSNGRDCIVSFIDCFSVHLKTFNHADYVHSNC